MNQYDPKHIDKALKRMEKSDALKGIHRPDTNIMSFFNDIEDFYLSTGSVPRSNCRVSNEKLLNAGVKISNVHDSIENCVKKVNELGS